MNLVGWYECGMCGGQVESENDLTVHGTLHCTDCWANENCLAECGLPHDGPPSSVGEHDDPVWECPSTSVRFVFEDGEWEADQWNYPDFVGGRWLRWPDEAGYSQCCECSEWSDDGTWNEWGTYYCSCHYRSENERQNTPPKCDECGPPPGTLTHYDPLTEAVFCASCAERHPKARPIPAAA